VKTYRTPRELLAVIDEQVLVAKPRLAPRGRATRSSGCKAISPLERIAALLHSGRHYFAVTIYLEAGGRLLRRAHCGPESGCHSMAAGEGIVGKTAQSGHQRLVPDVSLEPDYKMCFPETRSEFAIPIKIAGHVLGVIDVESDQPDTFGPEDRVLLKDVASRLALFFTRSGKYLLMKAREAAAQAPAPTGKPALPVPAEQFRAAAGVKTRP
jgi:L-methionine (R)-S-oxide reductase